MIIIIIIIVVVILIAANCPRAYRPSASTGDLGDSKDTG